MRHAFTLVELLITIVIIAILAGLTLGALQSARETAREKRTRATIAKLHAIVMDRYETYHTRRVDLAIPPNTSPKDTARLLLYAKRDLMRMEMPSRRQDILSLTMTGIPEPLIHKRLRDWHHAMEQNATWRNYTHVEAEIFYAWVVLSNPEAREQFADSEVGDTDGDEAMEFLDGWRRPIFFLRWPVKFTGSDIQVADPGSYHDGMIDPGSHHDPFDSRWVQPNAFRLVPLIYSAGPDGVYDIDVRPGIDYGASPVVDPYRWATGNPIGSGGHLDNIHNHRLAP